MKEEDKNYKPLGSTMSAFDNLHWVDLWVCYIHAMPWLIQKTLLVEV